MTKYRRRRMPTNENDLSRPLRLCQKKEVHPHGALWGMSQWGQASWGEGSGSGVSVQDVETNGRGKSNDARMSTTASGEAEVLVTEERQLAEKVTASPAKCKVWNSCDFETFVRTRERSRCA